MLRPAGKVPERQFNNRKSRYEPDLREFQRQRLDVAIVEWPGISPRATAATINSYLRNHRDRYPGIKAAMRGGTCYLYRTEDE